MLWPRMVDRANPSKQPLPSILRLHPVPAHGTQKLQPSQMDSNLKARGRPTAHVPRQAPTQHPQEHIPRKRLPQQPTPIPLAPQPSLPRRSNPRPLPELPTLPNLQIPRTLHLLLRHQPIDLAPARRAPRLRPQRCRRPRSATHPQRRHTSRIPRRNTPLWL